LTDRVTRARLATVLRAELRNAPPPEDEDLLREAYERFGVGERAQVEADYAVATFDARQDAASFRDRAAEDPGLVDTADEVTRVEGDLLTEPSVFRQAIRSAPLGTPHVVGMADGRWAVIRVDRREEVPVRFEDIRDQLADEVGSYLNEVELVRQLRDEATIVLDTMRFEQLYELSD
jgi:hypothetical protein